MPKPPTPSDLEYCFNCGKLKGEHKGWFGAQCFCDRPTGHAADQAHSIGVNGKSGGVK